MARHSYNWRDHDGGLREAGELTRRDKNPADPARRKPTWQGPESHKEYPDGERGVAKQQAWQKHGTLSKEGSDSYRHLRVYHDGGAHIVEAHHGSDGPHQKHVFADASDMLAHISNYLGIKKPGDRQEENTPDRDSAHPAAQGKVQRM